MECVEEEGRKEGRTARKEKGRNGEIKGREGEREGGKVVYKRANLLFHFELFSCDLSLSL